MVERLRLGDVEHIPTDTLESLITGSFDNLVTVAVAEATNGFVSQRTRRLLRKAERRLDWQDALLCACGELQVAAERMRYASDPRLEATEDRLRRVRLRGNEASVLVKKLHRNDFHNSVERKSGVNSHLTAQGWLRQAFPEEYADLVQRERARRNLSEAFDKPPFKDVHEQIKHACACGQTTAPRTPAVEALLAASDTALSSPRPTTPRTKKNATRRCATRCCCSAGRTH